MKKVLLMLAMMAAAFSVSVTAQAAEDGDCWQDHCRGPTPTPAPPVGISYGNLTTPPPAPPPPPPRGTLNN